MQYDVKPVMHVQYIMMMKPNFRFRNFIFVEYVYHIHVQTILSSDIILSFFRHND